MNNKPQDLLKQLIDKPENFSPESIEKLVNDSLEFFRNYLKLSKNNEDKEAKEKAAKELIEFNEILQNTFDHFAKRLGLSASELFEFSNNKANFTKDQWAFMQSINNNMTKFNTAFISDVQSSKKTKAGKASKSQEIAI